MHASLAARGEILQRHVQHQADVPDVGGGEVFQHGDQIQKLVVVGVGEPRRDRDSVLRVEDVGCRGVVNNDCLAERSADLAEIFDVVSLVVVA